MLRVATTWLGTDAEVVQYELSKESRTAEWTSFFCDIGLVLFWITTSPQVQFAGRNISCVARTSWWSLDTHDMILPWKSGHSDGIDNVLHHTCPTAEDVWNFNHEESPALACCHTRSACSCQCSKTCMPSRNWDLQVASPLCNNKHEQADFFFPEFDRFSLIAWTHLILFQPLHGSWLLNGTPCCLCCFSWDVLKGRKKRLRERERM